MQRQRVNGSVAMVLAARLRRWKGGGSMPVAAGLVAAVAV
jgi:hypothetical protein